MSLEMVEWASKKCYRTDIVFRIDRPSLVIRSWID
jgi:hypothetical protein